MTRRMRSDEGVLEGLRKASADKDMNLKDLEKNIGSALRLGQGHLWQFWRRPSWSLEVSGTTFPARSSTGGHAREAESSAGRRHHGGDAFPVLVVIFLALQGLVMVVGRGSWARSRRATPGHLVDDTREQKDRMPRLVLVSDKVQAYYIRGLPLCVCL